MTPLPRWGPLPVWGIGLALAIAGTVAIIVRGHNDLTTTGLGLAVLLGVLLLLGTQRVRYLTLAILATSWVFTVILAGASAYELNGWLEARSRLADEPGALAAGIADYEALARRCARCSVTASDGRSTAVEEAITELRADSEKLTALLQSQVRSRRLGFVSCAPFTALFLVSSITIRRWYLATRR